MMARSQSAVLLALGFLALAPLHAGAAVFSTIQFLEPGRHALGIEPEVVLTSGAGIGATARFTTGLSDLNNLTFMIGSGSGPRRFRLGGNVTADFFPDIDGQPGIGMALQVLYSSVSINSAGTGVTEVVGTPPSQGRLDVTLIPYIHNTFSRRGGDVEPYLAFPFGVAIRDSRLQSTTALGVGSFFRMTETAKTSLELTVGLANTESALSGGFLYYLP